MDHQQWETINKIVDSALDLPRDDRLEFIQKECRDDRNLRDEVIHYLESIEKSDTENFLEQPSEILGNLADDLAGQRTPMSDSSFVGQTIENYKLLELIGRGGMGSVFMAERTDDAYQKKVAFKLLRKGMNTPSNLVRFKRERNILANFDHPNITQLMDGGVTGDGLPFLVMDYVEGTQLYEYCDSNQLSIEKRMELFKTICSAVRHAHKNAVIHRDLKPSNILITHEGKVKVLDFGIAKLTEEGDSEKDGLQNRPGAKILTLKYAAPEQLLSDPVTTASDTYMLGMLLYEMLAGVHPFDFDSTSISKMEKVIRREIPVKPSKRIERLPESDHKEIAQNRKTDPQNLIRVLSGDLDAIVLKALRKEPERRYHSVEKILNDLHRMEKNQTVSARDETLLYKSKKFFGRRKRETGAACFFVIAIFGFITFHTSQITHERNIAQQEARRADEVSAFLLQLFDTESAEEPLSAAGLLQKGMSHLEGLENEPAHANMASVMGQAYLNFGNYEKAEKLLQQAMRESKQVYGEESIEYATALFRMGLLYQESYRWEEAVSDFQKSYELHSALLGDEHIKTADILSHLSTSLRNTGRLQDAREKAGKAIEIQQEILEPTDNQMLTSMANLAYVLREQGEMKEAESIYLQIIDRSKNNPAVEQYTLASYYNNLGYLYRKKKEYNKANENYRKALALQKENYVEGHPEIINTRRNLASSLYFQERKEEAEFLFKKNIETIREKYSTNHWRTASALNVVGLFYLKNGQFPDAEPYLQESTVINRKVLGNDHLWTAYSEGLLAACLRFQEKNLQKADSLYRHHYRLFLKDTSNYDTDNRNQLNRLIEIYDQHTKSDSQVAAYQKLL